MLHGYAALIRHLGAATKETQQSAYEEFKVNLNILAAVWTAYLSGIEQST